MYRDARTVELLESTTVPTMDDLYMTPEEVAQRLRCDVNTLANMRSRGEGIPYAKPTGSRVLYLMSDVLAAETHQRRGFAWHRLAAALDAFDDLKPAQRSKLLAHLKHEMTKP